MLGLLAWVNYQKLRVELNVGARQHVNDNYSWGLDEVTQGRRGERVKR